MNEEELNNYRVSELKNLLRERGLPLSGRKTQLIDRLLGREERESQQELPPIIVDQHVIDLGHEEIEKARLEQKRIRLLTKPVAELKEILRSRGQKVGGNKNQLIFRLLGLEKDEVNKKEKRRVTNLLRKDIREGKDLHSHNGSLLEVDAVYHSRSDFRKFNLQEFQTLLDEVREEHEKNTKQSSIDDKEVLDQLEFIGGMAERTHLGHKSWRVHPAKELLRQDLEAGKHLIMKPKNLHKSRPEYWKEELDGLPLKVFRKKIAQELLRTKQNNFNQRNDERENKGLNDESLSEWSESSSDDDQSST